MTEGGDTANLIRRVVVPRLHRVPGLKARVLSSETPALHRSGIVRRPLFRRGLTGRLCPNAVLDDGRRVDDIAAGRFAVITSTTPSPTQRATVRAHGAVLIRTPPATTCTAGSTRATPPQQSSAPTAPSSTRAAT